MQNSPAIVLDTGSLYTKIGYAGEEYPRSSFASVVGKTRQTSILVGGSDVGRFLGEAAVERQKSLNLNRPIQRGQISDWDEAELLWEHAFQNELRIESSGQPILLTETILNPVLDREKIAQIFFEKFEISALGLQPQVTMSLYSSAKTSGLVVESGDGISQIVPIYEGYELLHATRKIKFGGSDVTDYLQRLLAETGNSLCCVGCKSTIQKLKEDHAYVKESRRDSWGSDQETRREVSLPDGQQVTVDDERYLCTEALFDPTLAGKAFASLPMQTVESIQETSINLQSLFYSNIVLSGGNTKFRGFKSRFQEEIGFLTPQGTETSVSLSSAGKYSSWLGGSIFASLDSFEDFCISKQDYEEYGPRVLWRK